MAGGTDGTAVAFNIAIGLVRNCTPIALSPCRPPRRLLPGEPGSRISSPRPGGRTIDHTPDPSGLRAGHTVFLP